MPRNDSAGGGLVAQKRKKITVLLDHEEFQRFEDYCAECGFKKSTLIARLIKDHLNAQGFQPRRELPLASPNAASARGGR